MKIFNCTDTETVLYQVKQGQDLSTIARSFNVKINAIIRNNNNIELYEGEIVKIVRKNCTQHIVKPMETLDKIASIYNTSADQIIEQNNLSSKRLFVGQLLDINNKQTS